MGSFHGIKCFIEQKQCNIKTLAPELDYILAPSIAACDLGQVT